MAEFVLGCVQLGLVYGAANRTGKPTQAYALSLLANAVDQGIRTFDVARAYGDAEERLGEGLHHASVAIVTKLSPLGDLPANATPDEAAKAAQASITQSCLALRRQHLDTVLLHRAEHRTAFDGAIWQCLRSYQAEGVIGKLGVSVQNAAEALDALADGSVRHIQLPFNLLDWRWHNVLARAQSRGDVTLHVRSVFLQGLLAAGDATLWPPINGVDAPHLVAQIASLANDLERESPADLCLAYVRGHAAINGVVIGLETEEQLVANVKLFAKPALTAEQCALVAARLPKMPEQLLNPALWPKR